MRAHRLVTRLGRFGPYSRLLTRSRKASELEKLERVFVSSTYTDLLPERQAVLQTLLEADCIPAGMELFPATDDDKWTLITRVIRGCDYYIVVVGGRYGSVDPVHDIGFTEREYDYAESIGLPIMAFLHAAPGKIELDKSELSFDTRTRLQAFRKKVERRTVKYWSTPDELGAQVAKSLIQLRKSHPAVGWVRASEAVPPETRQEIADLRAQTAELQLKVERAQVSAKGEAETADLASGTDRYGVTFQLRYWTRDQARRKAEDEMMFMLSKETIRTYNGTIDLEWDSIFREVGPRMINEATENDIERALASLVFQEFESQCEWPEDLAESDSIVIRNPSMFDIIVQFFALDLIERSDRKRTLTDRNTYWTLTRRGEDHLMKLRAIRRSTR